MEDTSKKAEYVPAHIGALIRKWRDIAGKTQAEVGGAIGTGKSHVSQVENGKGNLSLPKFLALCRFLGVPASRILEQPFLPKERDLDRLTKDLAGRVGVGQLHTLTTLSPSELALFFERGHEAVTYQRSKRRDRPRHTQPGAP